MRAKKVAFYLKQIQNHTTWPLLNAISIYFDLVEIRFGNFDTIDILNAMRYYAALEKSLPSVYR